ncbi:MAG: CorA family divalent cation transporter [Synechococcaceae cyanobacterium]
MLRLTPGALFSNRLEQRPAAYPPQLWLNSGRVPTQAEVMLFRPEGPSLEPLDDLRDLRPWLDLGFPIWVRVRGLENHSKIRAMLASCGVPEVLWPALLEVPQRPQVDCLEETLLVVLHRLGLSKGPEALVSDQVGALLRPGLLITIEEAGLESFPELSRWLLSRNGELGHRELDDILHFVIDDLLDDLFPMLEFIANRLDDLEERVLTQPKPRLLNRTFHFRGMITTIRRQIWPLRHQIKVLLRQRKLLLGREATIGFEEMSEIVELLYENCAVLRLQCDAITQGYTAGIGNRMNQVMKALTIVTSIFAPLTLIAGIYGMNFQRMPELHWSYGYPFSLLLMGLVAGVQLWWLRSRGWFQDWTGQGRP